MWRSYHEGWNVSCEPTTNDVTPVTICCHNSPSPGSRGLVRGGHYKICLINLPEESGRYFGDTFLFSSRHIYENTGDTSKTSDLYWRYLDIWYTNHQVWVDWKYRLFSWSFISKVTLFCLKNHRLHNEMAIFGGTPVYPIVTDQCSNHDQMHIPCGNTKQPKNTNLSIKCAHLSENLWVNLWENLEVASVLGGCTNGWTNPLVLMIIHLLGYRNMYNVAMTVCVHLQRKCIN